MSKTTQIDVHPIETTSIFKADNGSVCVTDRIGAFEVKRWNRRYVGGGSGQQTVIHAGDVTADAQVVCEGTDAAFVSVSFRSTKDNGIPSGDEATGFLTPSAAIALRDALDAAIDEHLKASA